MSHADAMVREMHGALLPLYPIPPCLEISDEPAGDFGIAHFYGVRADGCGVMTFDEGYLPSRHTVAHELGHGLHAYVQRFLDADPYGPGGVLFRFWSACGFTVTVGAATSQAAALEAAGEAYQGWRRRPSEIIAELFAFAVLGDYLLTETYGADPWVLRDRALAFFAAEKGDDMARLDPADMAELKAHLDKRVALAEQHLAVEIVGAIKSGFNVTLPTLLNRLAAGDKDVGTAPIDG